MAMTEESLGNGISPGYENEETATADSLEQCETVDGSVPAFAGESAEATDGADMRTVDTEGGNTPKEQPKPTTRLQQFWQFVKFALFSASAGVIQLVTTTTLHQWTGWLLDYYWAAYVIGLTLSVIWNFTLNRKFTFKASSNVPIAMTLVVIYNLIIVVPLAFGGQALEELWGHDYGIVVTVIELLINFVTEFLWDKFIVFNDKIINKIARRFKRKDKNKQK